MTGGLPGPETLEGEREEVSWALSPFSWLTEGRGGLNEYESPPPPRAGPSTFLHTSPSLERLLRIKCKSHIYWYESDCTVTFSQQRV